MTLQTSGAITLANIQTEFGGTDPISFSEYYAGGTYVPSGTSGTNGAVPTSGAISFFNFYGTSDVLDIQTVVAGSYTGGAYGPFYTGKYSTVGSVSDGTSNIYGGAAITNFYLTTAATNLILVIAGVVSNSGWTTLSWNRNNGAATGTRLRSAATFSTAANSTWTWPNEGTAAFVNGQTTVFTFT